jgi:hypothetical protein
LEFHNFTNDIPFPTGEYVGSQFLLELTSGAMDLRLSIADFVPTQWYDIPNTTFNCTNDCGLFFQLPVPAGSVVPGDDGSLATVELHPTSFTFDSEGSMHVPEPDTWALLLIGFFGVGANVRRRRLITRPHEQPVRAPMLV